jgi:hypothetical protein
MLKAFDGPDMFNSCARRNTTTTPLQSLLLLNNEWSFARAKAFANRVHSEAQDDPGRIQRAYRLAFARDPGNGELEAATSFLSHNNGASPRDAWVDLCHVLLNANEFIYID